MDKKNIYQRMNAVMKEVSFVKKEDKKVNNQYTFASHDAVIGALRGSMVEHGILMVPTISEMTQDGNRTVAKLTISFVNIDCPEDNIVVHYTGYGIDSQDKGPGKAVSYAVKYALLKVFSLETGDDVEKSNVNYQPPSASVSEEETNDQIGELISLFPPEEADLVQGYIDHWKEMLEKTQGTKWLIAFSKGINKSLAKKDMFVRAVYDWHLKKKDD